MPWPSCHRNPRLGPHSKGDDLRSEDEKQRMAARDPLQRLRARLPAAADLADQAAGQFLGMYKRRR